jgi:tetratricopeptide (TPR) repeat protein
MLMLLLSATWNSMVAQELPKLSVEEEQQFLYYFYEAERLIQSECIAEAKPLVEFCYALNPNDATINNYLGLYAQVEEDIAKMTEYFRRAYELNPEEYWFNHHVLMLKSKDKKTQQQAVKQMAQLAQKDKKNAELHETLQKAYILLEQYDKALEVQDCLDSINGYDAMSAMQRYRLHATLKQEKQAIYEIERYLDIDPDNYQFQVFRMQLYEQTQQPAEKMIVAYKAILKMDSRNIVVMNNLAWNLCLLKRDLVYAEQLSRATIMREPSNPIYLDTYGWIMYLLGDCQSALFYLERAIEYSGTEVEKEIATHYKKVKKACK